MVEIDELELRASTPPAKGRGPETGWADVTEVVTDDVGRSACSGARSPVVLPVAVTPSPPWYARP